jgi:adenine-specific DNA-methyltransferase
MTTFNISNRRYLGNKYKLLNWIKEIVDNNCTNVQSFFDVFSGTGSVASAFTDKRLVVCDMMRSNYYAALCWFSPEKIDREKLTKLLEYYNNFDASKEDNYMSQNFSDTYFNKNTCQKIGYIRDDIEAKFLNGEVNEREKACVITSLFYAMDRISHTCGHYDSFIRDGKYEGVLELRMPDNDYPLNENNHIFCADSNTIADQEQVDVAYLDPPYNSRQYCDAYHLLENIALWNKPEVYGIAKKMDRTSMKSKYCKSIQAAVALEDLVRKLNCRYILFSYNNNGKKLQCRSNAKLTDDEIVRILSIRGDVQVFSMDYRGFDAGKSEFNKDNKERLFLCSVRR